MAKNNRITFCQSHPNVLCTCFNTDWIKFMCVKSSLHKIGNQFKISWKVRFLFSNSPSAHLQASQSWTLVIGYISQWQPPARGRRRYRRCRGRLRGRDLLPSHLFPTCVKELRGETNRKVTLTTPLNYIFCFWLLNLPEECKMYYNWLKKEKAVHCYIHHFVQSVTKQILTGVFYLNLSKN